VNTAWFHKRRWISWLTGRLSDSQEVLCSLELLIFLTSILNIYRYGEHVRIDKGKLVLTLCNLMSVV
jgi:hypothetical protein